MLCLDEHLASDLCLRLFLTTSANYLDLTYASAPAVVVPPAALNPPDSQCEVAHVCLSGT